MSYSHKGLSDVNNNQKYHNHTLRNKIIIVIVIVE